LNATSVPPKVCPTCGGRYAADALFCPNDGTPLSSAGSVSEGRVSEPPDLYLGREISGHIEIRQLAGIGAMGRVYRAFQKGIERDVAVKILHRELSANPQLVARFHREAKVASRLSHPNVVQVHLAGQLPDGALFIVMEYLDGLSLQSALAAAGGYMPLPRALHIALQICDAAGEAHSQGVVHRDLKPENVMLVRRGDDVDYIKVLDFGIARLNWGDQSMATAAGLIFGTARYISPEGAQGEAVGPQGDVYAIATLLYQMLGGRTPFEGDQAVALLVQQIHDAAPALKSIPRAADVPDPIAAVVMKNLAKRPSDRAPDARALGRLLIDAAKASGLSPEELVPRSMLLGSKPGPMQLPPVQRTKQLELPAELAARLAAASPPSNAQASRGAAHAPGPGSRVAATSGAPVAGFIPAGGVPQGTQRIDAVNAPKIPPTLGMAAMSGTTAPIAVVPRPGASQVPRPDAPPHAPRPDAPYQGPGQDAPYQGPGQDAPYQGPGQDPAHQSPRPEPAPGAPTTKWSPPAELAARLAPAAVAPPVPPPSVAALGHAPRKRVDSSVEDTMDDDDEPQRAPAAFVSSPAPSRDRPRTRTEFGEPIFASGAAVSPLPSPLPSALNTGVAPSLPSSVVAVALGGSPFLPDSPGGEVAHGEPANPPAPGRVPSSPSSAGKPLSTVESTLSEEDGALAPVPPLAAELTEPQDTRQDTRRARSRAVVIVVFCFIVGAIVAGTLFKMGIVGPNAQTTTLSARVNLANDAMRHKRWDSPAGDNVRDITDDGLARWPKDARLFLDIRERAADELVKEAVGRKFEGDLVEALHLAHLANQLDPTDTTAEHLVTEYETESAAPLPPMTASTLDASAAPSHPLVPGAHPNSQVSPPPTTATTARVSIDALPARPRIGQPVAFSAKVTTSTGSVPKVLEDVHFKLNGPGLAADTRLTPVPDVPGTYRAAFTFFEAGKYELTFEARVDGVLIRTQRLVLAGDEGPGTPSPPPAPSVKWL
jgi:serine/threonine protein kinase